MRENINAKRKYHTYIHTYIPIYIYISTYSAPSQNFVHVAWKLENEMFLAYWAWVTARTVYIMTSIPRTRAALCVHLRILAAFQRLVGGLTKAPQPLTSPEITSQSSRLAPTPRVLAQLLSPPRGVEMSNGL